MFTSIHNVNIYKGHAHLQAVKTHGGSGWVKAPDILTFGTTRVVGRQPHAPAAFTPRRNPGTHI
jgi:hypothetical protein